MEVKEEVLDILQKVWTKLQGLPHANSLELGAFFVLILFVATILFLMVLSCVHCCCCGKPKYQGSRVQPLHSTDSNSLYALEALSPEKISQKDMAIESVLQQQKPPESPELLVEWFLHRMHQEPWAVGGLVVMGLFVLTIVSLVIFALLYGCCRTQTHRKQKKDGVI